MRNQIIRHKNDEKAIICIEEDHTLLKYISKIAHTMKLDELSAENITESHKI
ncbi:hypothetical protein [Bacteroidetes bacterium endosymbiont of Geopemphigus sp.]|uniref:hypothetical protein n=1 Tax=Bacteroidetes bacterium endosymbiont of Geopemphigus sp. TaxID=2047937 RepID=UPI0018A8015C|nr:hypothetical protein [Bacteroidetes bacterium endosymbiont of Geopemphigus sp.]